MNVDSVMQSALISGVGTTTASSESASVLGKDDFLMLLVEQMKAQDPLNPKDPSEFTAQLAQFSSLEQLVNLRSALDNLALLSASMNNLGAANFLGREVTASGSQVAVASGKGATIHYNLAASAASVTIRITDSSGAVVRTVELGPQSQGAGELVWDANGSSGAPCPDGLYSVQVEALDASGQPIQVDTFLRGRVSGVVYDNGMTLLEMDGQRIPIADILSVRLLDSEV